MLENQVAPNMMRCLSGSVIHFSCPVTSICRSCKPPTSTSFIPSCKCETLLCHCSFGYRNVERNIRNSTCVWLWVLINTCDIKWLLTLCRTFVFSTHFAVLVYYKSSAPFSSEDGMWLPICDGLIKMVTHAVLSPYEIYLSMYNDT